MNGTTARGAAAGAVGVVAMDVVTWAMYRRESRIDLLREHRNRVYGKDPAHALVRHIGRATGTGAGRQQPNGAGVAVHYVLGMGPGAAYAHLRTSRPRVRAANGALYGATLYLVNDLLMARALRIAGPQTRYPKLAHVRGVVGHVVLGVVTEATLRGMEATA